MKKTIVIGLAIGAAFIALKFGFSNQESSFRTQVRPVQIPLGAPLSALSRMSLSGPHLVVANFQERGRRQEGNLEVHYILDFYSKANGSWQKTFTLDSLVLKDEKGLPYREDCHPSSFPTIFALALSEKTLAIGSCGRVFVIDRQVSGEWLQTSILIPGLFRCQVENGSLAISADGTRILFGGCPSADGKGLAALFERRQDSVWKESKIFSGGNEERGFGSNVALVDNSVIIESSAVGQKLVGVHFFSLSASEWIRTKFLELAEYRAPSLQKSQDGDLLIEDRAKVKLVRRTDNEWTILDLKFPENANSSNYGTLAPWALSKNAVIMGRVGSSSMASDGGDIVLWRRDGLFLSNPVSLKKFLDEHSGKTKVDPRLIVVSDEDLLIGVDDKLYAMSLAELGTYLGQQQSQ